jgi:hypothetical protein
MQRIKIIDLIIILTFSISVLIGYILNVSLTYIAAFFLVVLFVRKYDKKANDSSTFSLSFLTIFLPFYALLRAYLIYKNIWILSSFVNLVRDLIIIGSLLIIVIKQNGRFRKSSLNSLVEIGILLLLVNYFFGFVISLMSGYITLGIKGIHLNVIPILLVYIILSSNRINIDSVQKFISLFINIALVISIIGIYFYIIRPEIFGRLFLIISQQDESNFYQVLNYSRMVSTFLSPNVFGSYMAISIIVVANNMINYKERQSTLKNTISIILFSTCLILSFSRGAWLFALIGVLVVLSTNILNISSKKIRYILFFISSSTMAVIIISIFDPELFQHITARVLSVFDSSNTSSYGRISNWIDVFDNLSTNIFGLGLGVTGINLSYYPELAQKLGVQVVDGYYIKLLAETGVIGALLFSLFIIFTLTSLVQFIKYANYKEKYVYILSLAVFVGFLFQSLGSNTFDYVNISPFLWIFIGLAIKVRRNQILVQRNDKTNLK